MLITLMDIGSQAQMARLKGKYEIVILNNTESKLTDLPEGTGGIAAKIINTNVAGSCTCLLSVGVK